MSKQSGASGGFLAPALIASCALALVAIWWLARGTKPEPRAQSVENPPEAQVEPEPTAPAEPPAVIEPAPSALDAALAAPVLPEAGAPPETERLDGSLLAPALRQHALAIIPGTILHAVEEGRLEHIRSIRDQLAARSDNPLAASDMEALGMVIDCMEHTSDARDEARDFLQFGGGTMLKEALERACE